MYFPNINWLDKDLLDSGLVLAIQPEFITTTPELEIISGEPDL